MVRLNLCRNCFDTYKKLLVLKRRINTHKYIYIYIFIRFFDSLRGFPSINIQRFTCWKSRKAIHLHDNNNPYNHDKICTTVINRTTIIPSAINVILPPINLYSCPCVVIFTTNLMNVHDVHD